MASSARPGGLQPLPARRPARLRLRVFDLGGSGLKSALFESSDLAGSNTLAQLEPSLVLGCCPRNAHPRDWLRASVASLDAEVANAAVRFGFSLSGIEKLGGWDPAPAIARSKIRQRGYGGPRDDFPLTAATRAELEAVTTTMCGNDAVDLGAVAKTPRSIAALFGLPVDRVAVAPDGAAHLLGTRHALGLQPPAADSAGGGSVDGSSDRSGVGGDPQFHFTLGTAVGFAATDSQGQQLPEQSLYRGARPPWDLPVGVADSDPSSPPEAAWQALGRCGWDALGDPHAFWERWQSFLAEVWAPMVHKPGGTTPMPRAITLSGGLAQALRDELPGPLSVAFPAADGGAPATINVAVPAGAGDMGLLGAALLARDGISLQ